MKKASWMLAIAFGLAFLGATLTNAALVGRARAALAGTASGQAWTGEGRGAAGGQPAPPAGKARLRYHLVVVVPDADDSFFAGLLDGVATEAAGAGAAVQVFRYPAASPLDAERYFDIALGAKVDGLIMYAPRDYRGQDRHAEAARSGVIFIPVGTDAPPGETGLFIGSGSLLQGIEGGRLVGGSLGSAARVGMILAGEGWSGAEDPLYSGLLSALGSYPGAKVVAVALAQPGILSGEAVAESMLRENPSINAVLCSNARDTVGAAQVLIDRSEVGRVLIIGADESPDIRRYIEKGVVAATVVRDSRRIGQEAVRAFTRLKQGARMTGRIETGFLVITRKEGLR